MQFSQLLWFPIPLTMSRPTVCGLRDDNSASTWLLSNSHGRGLSFPRQYHNHNRSGRIATTIYQETDRHLRNKNKGGPKISYRIGLVEIGLRNPGTSRACNYSQLRSCWERALICKITENCRRAGPLLEPWTRLFMFRYAVITRHKSAACNCL